jgi:CubicO group peptidase (beta-lactamase class C family)
VALAHRGELVAFETFGEANNETRYVVYSATKVFVAGAVWALIGDGLIDVTLPVVHYVPEFGTNGKEVVTVEHVMLHTSGFPDGTMPSLAGGTSAERCAAFARWTLKWEPGTQTEYHPTSAHWVLAEIIERVTGRDYRDVVEQRVTVPAGLPKVLGDTGHLAAHLTAVGEFPTAEEFREAFGIDDYPLGEVTSDALLRFNNPEAQRLGMPGGGGVMRAADLALYYQAIIANPGQMWDPEVLHDAKTNVRNDFPDPVDGVPAGRTLGMIKKGEGDKAHLRGMGHLVSPLAVGHNGARGQVAWGDPATGLSLGYCTNGLDQHTIRQNRRNISISNAAARCITQ